MTTALRVGLLVSGALHVAALVGVTVPFGHDTPAIGEDRSITLTLVVSQPPAMMPSVVPVAKETSVSETVVEADPAPSPEPAPVVANEPSVAEPPRPTPPVKPKRAAAAKAIVQPRPAVDPVNETDGPTQPSVVMTKAPSSPPVVPVIDSEARQHYLVALALQIDRRKFYPRASRRRGEEGMVVVGFVIQRNGEFTDLAIVESSGHRRLDEAALETLQRVTPFERIPEAIDRDRWPITVPIAFSLRG